mmetsp:Transcript_136599/g.265702  ORF Transcript_136599/g.265702 Transcript_136599/m.265702 type:complete len:126 (+) Transcript_136599:276-653(+)
MCVRGYHSKLFGALFQELRAFSAWCFRRDLPGGRRCVRREPPSSDFGEQPHGKTSLPAPALPSETPSHGSIPTSHDPGAPGTGLVRVAPSFEAVRVGLGKASPSKLGVMLIARWPIQVSGQQSEK